MCFHTCEMRWTEVYCLKEADICFTACAQVQLRATLLGRYARPEFALLRHISFPSQNPPIVSVH